MNDFWQKFGGHLFWGLVLSKQFLTISIIFDSLQDIFLVKCHSVIIWCCDMEIPIILLFTIFCYVPSDGVYHKIFLLLLHILIL